ncbi:outer membrane lipoprotein chaperone LolA [Candidatus Nitrosacidococcus tergens]|uniref:Outer-membrane lipoprotein carrier protein n=1 Tax=Candidatus Nitrosacidococcus tergens TaxID=553981 RepID=A0A7G1Q8I6_9GAMM|nr:outer membrane lipoprotein chaperone LolA [Candidatus Nitrosacidococcus tergens]CAB1274700.1 Outer-membrane lipoprotein carrier protein [Candidatus Nitrosacidococcus tergens]
MYIKKLQLPRQNLVIVLLIGITMLPIRAIAADPKRNLESFLTKTQTLVADFNQTVLSEEEEIIEKSQGVFSLQRPGKFRWDYKKPSTQLIVADGSKIWFYDRELEQVTVKSLNQALGDAPALLLAGQDLPEDEYQVNALSSEDNLAWIEVIPQDQEGAFKRLLLGFQRKNLREMKLYDNLNQVTQLSFYNIKIGLSFEDSTFTFTPPEGADVIYDE